MKRQLGILIAVILLGSTALVSPRQDEVSEGEALKWVSIEEAQTLAKDSPRKVFIDFTAKWCGWCKVMDKKTFTDPEVARYLTENYYLVKLDYDSKKKFDYLGRKLTAKELAVENGITGLPTMLVTSPDFARVKKIVGYKKPKEFLSSLKKIGL